MSEIETQTGHGRYRLSWWTPTSLAGIEIWPDTPGNDIPESYFVVKVEQQQQQHTATAAAQYGFRRRCAWCGVVLRGWQLNLCRVCKVAVNRDSPLPPVRHRSRWDAEPDQWQRRPA